MRSTTIRENGKDIPYAKWITRKVQELRIKRELADTTEKRLAIDKEIRKTRRFVDFVNGNYRGDRSVEYCVKTL